MEAMRQVEGKEVVSEARLVDGLPGLLSPAGGEAEGRIGGPKSTDRWLDRPTGDTK
jgi:hypothetical protein